MSSAWLLFVIRGSVFDLGGTRIQILGQRQRANVSGHAVNADALRQTNQRRAERRVLLNVDIGTTNKPSLEPLGKNGCSSEVADQMPSAF